MQEADVLARKKRERALIKNADYLMGGFVFELKDLQEEGLKKGEHQKKIVEIFSHYFPNKSEISIDPSILSKSDYLKYLDIIGAPIKTHIRSASKQIKDTKLLLGRSDLLGGIILLNTGFGSFPHEIFAEQVERYARKDSKQLYAVVSISVWTHTNGFDSYVFYTNGFDSYVFYKFSPPESEQKEVIALQEAFSKRFVQMMTDVIQGKIEKTMERASPVSPVAFEHNGIDFAWIPPRIPLPWEQK